MHPGIFSDGRVCSSVYLWFFILIWLMCTASCSSNSMSLILTEYWRFLNLSQWHFKNWRIHCWHLCCILSVLPVLSWAQNVGIVTLALLVLTSLYLKYQCLEWRHFYYIITVQRIVESHLPKKKKEQISPSSWCFCNDWFFFLFLL